MRTPRALPVLHHDLDNLLGSVVSAAQIQDADVTRAQLRTALADGRIVRLGHGRYTTDLCLDDCDPWHRLRLRTAAFLDTAPPGAIAAGWSAVALHRIPSMTRPPPTPSVIRLRSGYHGSDRSAWGHTRYCLMPDNCVTTVNDLTVLTPGCAVADLARSTGRLTSLMLADAVASTSLGREQIGEAVQAMSRWPRFPRAAWLGRNCDGRAETPLETAGRYAAIVGGLPVPISNAWIGPGYPRARVDHWWPDQAVAGEGDGAVKYSQNAAAVIAAEKNRQSGLEFQGVTFVRYDWELSVRHRTLLAARFESALATASRPISSQLRWWTCDEGWAVIRGEASLEQFPGHRVRRRPYRRP